jgi:uncharacterized protein (TIGR00725 family)
MKRRTIVGVMGSGSSEHDECARPVGELIASLGADLLTGGGQGVMLAVSRAFTRYEGRRGICVGVLPCNSEKARGIPRTGYPNEFVELVIQTHLPYSGMRGAHDLSRNHINILSSAAIVALPGEDGTVSEVSLAIRYGKPVVAYALEARSLERFPATVPRVHELGELARFLQMHFVP